MRDFDVQSNETHCGVHQAFKYIADPETLIPEISGRFRCEN